MIFVYNNHLFSQLYDIKYSSLILIICTHVYDFKYFKQLYGFK